MPYFTDGNKSPCYHQKKSTFNGPCHVIPITKRPIEKMTTRSQAQYQQIIKNIRTGAFRDGNDSNNNSKNFVSSKFRRVPGISDDNADNDLIFPPQLPSSMDQIKISRLPFSPQSVLSHKIHKTHLTSFERKEILDYPEIYYIGKTGIKKRTPQTVTTDIGPEEVKYYGFDDDNGGYLPVIHDHIAYRYEPLKVIGKGTFGTVLNAHDHKKNERVALKIIRNQARFHTQAKEEIKILTKLLENDTENSFHVVHMYDNFMFRNHPCIVFELLSLNLFELTRKNSFEGLTLALIRRFTISILKCLYALSMLNIIHCDLKPENILLKDRNRSGIKVIDFGSSCFSNKRVHTYIQSRYYRSPEVILCAKYGPPIDMWSLGCILAELFLGRPLLNGENEGDQLACMMEILDVPPPTFLSECKTIKVRRFIDSSGNPIYCAHYNNGKYKAVASRSPRGTLRGPPGSRQLLPECSDLDFKDFIRRCLVWDPSDRMTPEMALKHRWLTKRREPGSEPSIVYIGL